MLGLVLLGAGTLVGGTYIGLSKYFRHKNSKRIRISKARQFEFLEKNRKDEYGL